MRVCQQIHETREAVGQARKTGRQVGFVPTMGALHEGHLSLVRRARRECDFVVVSIYVNPIQFVAGEDLNRYPRDLERDLQLCRQLGVDLVFAPCDRVMYPGERFTTVRVAKLTEPLCGACRPGHFDGVTTVVAKLFNIVQPDAAYFGQKDAQQAVVIGRMVRDLDFPVQIRVCPIVRAQDGLALSSRNAYLDEEQRRQARCLYKALQAAKEAVAGGERRCESLVKLMRAIIEGSGPVGIDYISIVDPATLEDLQQIENPALIALAVRIGRARLIDNILLDRSGAELTMDGLNI